MSRCYLKEKDVSEKLMYYIGPDSVTSGLRKGKKYAVTDTVNAPSASLVRIIDDKGESRFELSCLFTEDAIQARVILLEQEMRLLEHIETLEARVEQIRAIQDAI